MLLPCLAGSVLFIACNSVNPGTLNGTPSNEKAVSKDIHTQSNADSVLVKHLGLNIKVNFDTRRISGVATWDIDNTMHQSELVLDTYDLTIDSIKNDNTATTFKLGEKVQHLGKALHIAIAANTKQVQVYYHTCDSSRALRWLTPQQTHDKKYPFLFTQSESIYARSWVPCPDGPGIRFSYDARVEVPKDLLALMSATNPQQTNDSGIYHFQMEIPVPAYLLALAVGKIEFKPLGEKTGVYAEPGMLAKSAYELAPVNDMVANAGKLYGEYKWGRYDVIVLPPAFPIGGMENPRLTFATPTIIAGDRSLVSLIAHELAHSWSGNLVTNATWNDFWLNEGFTNYFERRIMESIYGSDYSDMLWELGYQTLKDNVRDLGEKSPDTHLFLNLKDRDPDDGLTDIPYEKGSLFLQLIEKTVGREKFDVFLKQYFEEHSFKTITTTAFLDYLDKNLLHGDTSLTNKIRINDWVYGPGIPTNCPRAGGKLFAAVDTARNHFLAGAAPTTLATQKWSTHEWLYFLHNMPAKLTVDQMYSLDKQFSFTNSGNCEIADLWYVVAIRNGYKVANTKIDEFLSTVGRRKFLEPIYSELMKSTDGAAFAKSLYNKYRDNYHPLAQESLDRIVMGKAK